jgi:hypothetical protein
MTGDDRAAAATRTATSDYIHAILVLIRDGHVRDEFIALLPSLTTVLDAMPMLSEELCGQAYRAARTGSIDEVELLIGRLNEFAVRAALGARSQGQC